MEAKDTAREVQSSSPRIPITSHLSAQYHCQTEAAGKKEQEAMVSLWVSSGSDHLSRFISFCVYVYVCA